MSWEDDLGDTARELALIGAGGRGREYVCMAGHGRQQSGQRSEGARSCEVHGSLAGRDEGGGRRGGVGIARAQERARQLISDDVGSGRDRRAVKGQLDDDFEGDW